MDSDEHVPEIVICLGSSCFARGNSEHLATIRNFLDSRGIEANIRFTGLLCQDQCKLGPNVSIGGRLHHEVTSERLLELLQQLDAPQGGDDGKA